MISADVQQTVDKILPVTQNLIPVSFKRKLEYAGYFLEEYIDKNKVLTIPAVSDEEEQVRKWVHSSQYSLFPRSKVGWSKDGHVMEISV